MADEKSRDWYDKRQWYLDERRAIVLPLIERALAAERYAVDFSLLTIKTGALLNGGALIALPAFGAFFQLSLFTASQGLFHGGVAFAFGLLFSWLAMVGAYHSNSSHAKHIFAASTVAEYRSSIALAKAIGERAEQVPDETKKHSIRSNENKRRSELWHIATTVLTIFSLIAFVIGAFIGGTALVEGSVHLGHT